MKKAYLIIPLAVSIGLLIIPVAAFSSNPIITVASDSMFPTLSPGDQLLINKVGIRDIKEGDIIAFDSHFEGVDILAHRVVEVSEKNNKTEIHTQGDHNDHPDFWVVTEESLIGIVAEVNPPLLGLQADAVRFPLIAIAVISGALLAKEFVRKKALEVEQLRCERCSYAWYPRIIDGKIKIPDTCPNKNCRSPYWQTPRRTD